MSEVKHILVVDDHFGTLQLMRELLTTPTYANYEVTTVRSGEEAGLELRRPYDLVITDLRLPGVHGIEVVKRARARHPNMPVIVMSGYPLEMAREEVQALDAAAFFRKPVDVEPFLEAVHIAIFGEPPPAAEPAPTAAGELPPIIEAVPIVKVKVTDEVLHRVERLRSDTGSDHIILGTIDGKILGEAGTAHDLDLQAISLTISRNLRGSFTLGTHLGADEPQSILYQTSKKFDVYTANIGKFFFVTMFFDAQAQRGRIGTVWIFVQRAIKELRPLLPEEPEVEVRAVAAPPPSVLVEQPLPAAVAVTPVAVAAEPEAKRKPAAPAYYEPPPPLELEPLPPEALDKLKALVIDEADDEADSFWETVDVAEPIDLGMNVSFEEALRQGLIDDEVAAEVEGLEMADISSLRDMAAENAVTENNAEAEAFWNAIVSGDTEKPLGAGGMSFEEALAQGLLAEELMGEAEAADVTVPEGLGGLSLEGLDDEEADSFWEEVLEDEGSGVSTKGLSWEEAQKKGLLPDDITASDE